MRPSFASCANLYFIYKVMIISSSEVDFDLVIDKLSNSVKLIKFLWALIKYAGKMIFLILDKLGVYHSMPVMALLADKTIQIEVFYLHIYFPRNSTRRSG
jgi:hypothetical protein